jgi:hypothetical protein
MGWRSPRSERAAESGCGGVVVGGREASASPTEPGERERESCVCVCARAPMDDCTRSYPDDMLMKLMKQKKIHGTDIVFIHIFTTHTHAHTHTHTHTHTWNKFLRYCNDTDTDTHTHTHTHTHTQ